MSTKKPVIDPDLSKIPEVTGDIEKAVEPFIPAKVRAGIYSVCGVIAVAATGAAEVVGGTVGEVLGIVGAAAAAVVGTTAISHIGK